MKCYILSLGLLTSGMAHAMFTVTANLPQPNGQNRVVEFDIDSNIFAQEICGLYQIPYSEPTGEDIQSVQDAHRNICIELNKEFVPLSHSEAKAYYNRVLGESMLDAIKEHRPESYPLIIGILAGKTAQNRQNLVSGS